ncbi:MAG: hypothetical protein AAFR23_05400 [Pseudomonadota bacterium]
MSETPIDTLKARAAKPESLGPPDAPGQVPDNRLAEIAPVMQTLAEAARDVSDRLPLQADAGDIFAVMNADADARETERGAA